MSRPALHLDFVAPAKTARWMGYALLTVALAITLELGLRYRAVQIELARLNVVQGMVAPSTTRKGLARDPRAEDQLKDAQSVIKQLALPWAGLINALENATTSDVAVLQLQPEAQQQVLRITAEARDHKAMLAYVKKLSENQLLSVVHWVNHQYQNDDPQRPLQFSVQATINTPQ